MKPTESAKISIINQIQDQLFFGLFRWAVHVSVYPIVLWKTRTICQEQMFCNLWAGEQG